MATTTRSRKAAAPVADPAPAPAATAAPRTPSRQAVVLVHGMGEQIPMDTIKSFVKTVWEDDPDIAQRGTQDPNTVWSHPDERTGSLELRLLTTRRSIPSGTYKRGVRTDFYELYWADLTAGSHWAQFTSWVRNLLLRSTKRVPKDVFSLWILLWFLSLLLGVIALTTTIPDSIWQKYMPWWLPQGLILAAVAGGATLLHRIVSQTFGRVVRYTRAQPDNIAARAAVRERGLALLRALHTNEDYGRVILASHSLGTILAHDLIGYFWAEREEARTIAEDSPAFPALIRVEKAAAAMASAGTDTIEAARTEYHVAQTELRRALAAGPGERWLISDFVTMGSPLTHAEFLLAWDMDDLRRRQTAREVPTCPPQRERLDKTVAQAAARAGLPVSDPPETTRLIAYTPKPSEKTWILHHAAPFAATRWTNLYDPARFIYQGDVIGGPMRENFGQAITDVNLAEKDKPSKGFSHTLYWDPDQSPVRIAELRKAVNLLDD